MSISYGGFPGGYGGYGGYGYGTNPMTGQGAAPVAVQTAPVKSTPLTPYETVNGELAQNQRSKSGMVIGGLSGVAAGAAIGAGIGTVVPVIGTAIGGVVGAVAGLIGGSFLGDKIGKFIAVEKDVHGDGKVDGNYGDTGMHNNDHSKFLGIF